MFASMCKRGITEAHVCEQLAQSRYLAVHRAEIEPGTLQSPVLHATVTPPIGM